AVAHCNFQLRGGESDQDEIFVKSLAAFYDKQYFNQTFNTEEVASDRGISVEMAARDLRYEWFEETRKNHHFDWVVVAHHRDDQVETFLLNLARGTGISGLTGMKVVSGKVVRPVLFASRKEIESYAADRNLQFREDSTNALTDFQRNKIRHLVLPLMEELNPSFRDRMLETMSHLRDTSAIYFQAVDRARELVVRRTATGDMEFSLSELKLLHPLPAYLFELLRPYHFNSDVIDEMVQVLDGQSGKQFFSATHRAVLDRDRILVQKLTESSDHRYYLEEDCSSLEIPVKLSMTTVKRDSSFRLNTSSDMACLDKDKLQFPLILRKWQKGDYFQPLGMTGMKKLSDFFVDEKFSLLQKENCWILANGEEIVWIIGERLDNRYKITSGTKNILVVKRG
ncbi:MAG TPA: tRNA lysidine(34) synthetase TilS, partial [Prolixibacteraceae bacterium]|nr:tRNA lysidine(34) synthetase TilS [Prolixibacteraceae bacterium]